MELIDHAARKVISTREPEISTERMRELVAMVAEECARLLDQQVARWDVAIGGGVPVHAEREAVAEMAQVIRDTFVCSTTSTAT